MADHRALTILEKLRKTSKIENLMMMGEDKVVEDITRTSTGLYGFDTVSPMSFGTPPTHWKDLRCGRRISLTCLQLNTRRGDRRDPGVAHAPQSGGCFHTRNLRNARLGGLVRAPHVV